MADIEPGTSSPAVKDLQINLNTILGGNRVKATGSFDEDTQAALDEVRDKFKLPGQSGGKVDAALLKKIGEAAEPRLTVEVAGQSYYVTQAEYAKLMVAAKKKAAAVARPYMDLYDAAKIAYDAHKAVRDKVPVCAMLVETVTGASFPDAGKLSAARSAAAKIEAAANGLILDEAKAAALSAPIRQLLADLDQYVEVTTLGGPKFVEYMEMVKGASVASLKVLGAIWSAGKSGPRQVGMSAAIGGYEALLNEIAGANDPGVTVSGSIGKVVKGAVVEGIVTAVMKGNAKGVGNIMDDAVKEAIAKSGAKTLEAYAIKAMNGATQKLFEEAIKSAFGEGDLSKAKSLPELKDAIVRVFIDGLAMGALGQVARNYTKGKVWQSCAKYLHKTAKGLNARAGWEDAVKKIVEMIGSKKAEEILTGLAPGKNVDADKVEQQIIDAIVNDSAVQKAMKEGAKGSKGN
jgi:peptidoglycan hydrolase-like protein with peptidoglycan-binding domain